MIVRAQGWAPQTVGGPHFGDVPPSSPFYAAIETAYAHGLLSGYADGSFRPGNSATRGQISKIVYLALAGPAATATPAPHYQGNGANSPRRRDSARPPYLVGWPRSISGCSRSALNSDADCA